MKKILLSSVALLGLTAGAMAADLPARRIAPAPILVPVFTWTGFYVGLNAGYGWGNNNNDHGYYDPFFGYGYGGGSNSNDGGFVGGAQAGFNYQTGMFVIGVEADIQYADIGGNRRNDNFYNPFFYGYGAGYGDNGNDDGYFGTVRARLGVAFDRVLVYATGGLAYGDINNGRNNNNAFYNPFFPIGFGYGYGYGNRNDSNDIGWTVGGGVEYAITNNFTVKVEGLYVNLGDNNNNNNYAYNPFFPFAGYGGGKNDNNNEFGVVRAGINYKF